MEKKVPLSQTYYGKRKGVEHNKKCKRNRNERKITVHHQECYLNVVDTLYTNYYII